MSVKSSYGFDVSIFISLPCNSIHHTLHFDADYTAICIKSRDEMMHFIKHFHIKSAIYLPEFISLFNSFFITT
ncbi:hypothetical protein HMPREF0971_00308 [Segatella oris F0302]|uniref:Uncharacterized protein n=1 Tax=Segatella oris F0302 TaxID=649760 RepID=D1QMM4_9BACT|nr:hypothetical protein HMPREF0971_00308 [Segatella oris F0302]